MGYMYLFWGFLFLCDININGFDILPDWLGYILFYIGFVKLESRSDHFRHAKPLSLVLLVLSVIMQILTLYREGAGVLGSLLNLVATILNMCMIFHICYGTSEIAARRSQYAFQHRVIRLWRWYILLTIIWFMVYLLMFIAPALGFVLGFIIGVGFLIIYVLLMLSMLDAEKIITHVRR